MNLTDLNRLSQAYPDRKRVGRGHGSGLGKTSGRGTKGARSRSGFSYRPGFEGGQMPLFRRIPKRGFSNAPFKTSYDVVNLDTLNRAAVEAAGKTINLEFLVEHGFLKSRHRRLKVLGRGTLSIKVDVVADRYSAQARAQIEAQGGEAKLLS